MLKSTVEYSRKITIIVIFVVLLSIININVSADDNNRPDLTIMHLSYDETVTEDDFVKTTIRIRNAGSENISIGEKIESALRIDGVVVSTNYTSNGLEAGESCFLNLSWNAELGPQTKQLISVID